MVYRRSTRAVRGEFINFINNPAVFGAFMWPIHPLAFL